MKFFLPNLVAGADAVAVARGAALLRAGGLVAFPTETVYGLGAHARDAQAVERIFRAKGRPADNPLIVHVAGADDLPGLVAAVSTLARELAARFWPGPLTLVLDAAGLPPGVTGGLATVGVRVPDHPVALALLRAAGVPVAAPSANRSGRPSPTTAAHVVNDLGGRVDLVLDGGPCRDGVESTVVDARGPRPVVLREGVVTREQLGVERIGSPAVTAVAPGNRHRHYTPRCAVVVAEPGQAGARAAALARAGHRVGLVANDPPAAGVIRLATFAGPAELARVLYAALRGAETARLDTVVVEAVEARGLGRAVMDRLSRAAGGAPTGEP